MIARSAVVVTPKDTEARVRTVFSLVAAGLLTVSLSTPLIMQGSTATMPDLTGYNAVQAVELLAELEFNENYVTVKSTNDEFIWTPEMWSVCSQSVDPNSSVPRSTKILLKVSLDCS